ncbi:hypothetical protein V8D89_000227 [Ganoderma adspersum]
MTTAELNPAYVPNSSQPPTAEALLVEEEFRDSLVNLTHDTVGLHESREDDHNGPLVGAHRVDNGHSYPSTRQQPEKLRAFRPLCSPHGRRRASPSRRGQRQGHDRFPTARTSRDAPCGTHP